MAKFPKRKVSRAQSKIRARIISTKRVGSFVVVCWRSYNRQQRDFSL